MGEPLKFLLAAAAASALSWIILIPVWQYPDEQAHFAQVQDVAEFGEVPAVGPNTSHEIALSEKILGTQRDSFGNNKFTYHPQFKIEYSKDLYGKNELEILNLEKSARKELVKNEATSNPPLYYFLAAGVYKIFDNTSLFGRVFAVRLFSSIFYILTIVFAFKIANLIFKKKAVSTSLAALVAFMPMFVFSTTGVLPDSLTNLLFTIIILLSIKILIEGVKSMTIIYIVIVIILGILTRQHFLISTAPVAIALFYQLYKSKNLKIFFGLVSIVILSLFASEKFLTNYPIANNFRIPDMKIIDLKLLLSGALLDHTVWTIKHTYSEVLPWYWGVYKWLSLTLPPLYYQIINRILLLSFLGFIIYLFNVIKTKKVTRENLIIIFMILIVTIYFASFLIWDYFFRAKNNFSFGVQGRYFFPLITAQMAIVLLGFWEMAKLIFPKYAKLSLLVLIILTIIANDFSLYYVASSYYETSNLQTFIIQISQYKPVILKGNIMLFIVVISLLMQPIFLISLVKAIIKEK